MLVTVLLLLVIAAFIATVISATGRAPLWVPVLLLCVAELVQVLPVR